MPPPRELVARLVEAKFRADSARQSLQATVERLRPAVRTELLADEHHLARLSELALAIPARQEASRSARRCYEAEFSNWLATKRQGRLPPHLARELSAAQQQLGPQHGAGHLLVDSPLRRYLVLKDRADAYLDGQEPRLRAEAEAELEPLRQKAVQAEELLSEAERAKASQAEAVRRFEADIEARIAEAALPQQIALDEAESYLGECMDACEAAYRLALGTDYLAAQAEEFGADEDEGLRDRLHDARLSVVRRWAESKHPSAPDDDQTAAISYCAQNTLVTARAGSGKTRAIVGRAAFLIDHCKVPGDQVLLLAFNRGAADEIAARLAAMGLPPAHAMTFHALAHRIVRPPEKLVYDSPENGLDRSLVFQSVVNDVADHAELGRLVQSVMLGHFREDWQRLVEAGLTLPQREGLAFRRGLRHEGLDGRTYKSFGEKAIANFLFEHDIHYRYEESRWREGFNYRPDFTIRHGPRNAVIEYFGMLGDAAYDEQAARKRAYWRQERDWFFIEMRPADVAQGPRHCESRLSSLLTAAGIACCRLSEDQIWDRIRTRAISRFTTMAGMFVGRCRKRDLSPAGLLEAIAGHAPLAEAEGAFLRVAEAIYSRYLDRLKAEGEEDFDGLLQRAVASVEAGQTRWSGSASCGDLSKIRFLMVDEFQDFAPLFLRLVQAARRRNTAMQVFGVGDDWQAINGFAGSDLRFFRDFDQHFPPATTLALTTNYRSSPAIVDLGNGIMEGRGAPARSSKRATGRTLLADLSKFAPTEAELQAHGGSRIATLVRRILARCLGAGKRVALLSRTNAIPYSGEGITSLDDCHKAWTEGFPKAERDRVKVATVHRYKGLEAETVVVLDALTTRYPFIHQDWVFTRLFGDSVEATIDAERRLFYVACTRAVETLVLVTQEGDESLFLDGIRPHLAEMDWDEFQPLEGVPRWIVRVGSALGRSGGTFPVREMLRAAGFEYRPGAWVHWARVCPRSDGSLEAFIDALCLEPWAIRGGGLEVRITDQNDALLRTCFVDRGAQAPC